MIRSSSRLIVRYSSPNLQQYGVRVRWLPRSTAETVSTTGSSSSGRLWLAGRCWRGSGSSSSGARREEVVPVALAGVGGPTPPVM